VVDPLFNNTAQHTLPSPVPRVLMAKEEEVLMVREEGGTRDPLKATNQDPPYRPLIGRTRQPSSAIHLTTLHMELTSPRGAKTTSPKGVQAFLPALALIGPKGPRALTGRGRG